LSSFGFGIYYLNNFTASYESILNSDETNYAPYTNTAVFTLDFVGLGLPV